MIFLGKLQGKHTNFKGFKLKLDQAYLDWKKLLWILMENNLNRFWVAMWILCVCLYCKAVNSGSSVELKKKSICLYVGTMIWYIFILFTLLPLGHELEKLVENIENSENSL